MSTQNKGPSQSFLASGDLSASQFKLVVVDANGRVAVAGAAVAAIGVLQDKPAAIDRACEVSTEFGAIMKVRAGAAVAINAILESDATGRVVTQSAGPKLAKALTAATAADDVIEVLWGVAAVS